MKEQIFKKIFRITYSAKNYIDGFCKEIYTDEETGENEEAGKTGEEGHTLLCRILFNHTSMPFFIIINANKSGRILSKP